MIDRTTLLSTLWDIQQQERHISDDQVVRLAHQYQISSVEIEGIISFYHFLHRKPAGRYTIYMNDSILSELNGYHEVVYAFEQETGARMGHIDPSGTFGLYSTSCIGLSDHEPAALINFYPFTELTPPKVQKIISQIKEGRDPVALARLPQTDSYTNLQNDSPIFFRPCYPGLIPKQLANWKPEDILELLKQADLRGMGGAFFPTFLKWDACRKETSTDKYIICNADEGEPGTFKDRILLEQYPGLMIDGMLMAAKAIGAQHGIIYLRAEYYYLKDILQNTLNQYRKAGWLGADTASFLEHPFDITLHLGAGAYICGEETALIESLEGKRGEPRTREYFPTQRGYLQQPTVVNNVETFCAAARIAELGPEVWLQQGTSTSKGHKVLSIAGDCMKPGVYEIPWGTTLGDLLDACEAQDPYYIQITGPSGTCVRADERHRLFAYEDLRCGGAVMIFNTRRSITGILENFARFFVRESCGVCTPCRAGNVLLQRQLQKLLRGLGQPKDLEDITKWGNMIMMSSRCGLGRTSPHSFMEAISHFPEHFQPLIRTRSIEESFDLKEATKAYDQLIQSHE